ncbi:restriction endonuclease [Neorhizobium sp. DAR64861/K0K2]|uniref:restriction endonuclease n=1 Tax=unclassified Neorhizobium TaxID=2629175 RepID=UPI003D2DCEED
MLVLDWNGVVELTGRGQRHSRRGKPKPDDKLEDWITPPDPVPTGWYQRRGYALERVIQRLLDNEGLAPEIHHRPKGEEIDGSFEFADRTFLLEAKWKADPVPASDFYAFKGKVDGKLVGTIGIFISMTGFAQDAIDALKFGKDINLILFSGSDFQLVAEGRVTFRDALRTKLRYAAVEGQPYLPLEAGSDAATKPAKSDSNQDLVTSAKGGVNIVVEGPLDQQVLQILLQRIDPTIAAVTRIWPAGGQLNVASLLRRLQTVEAFATAAVIESDMPSDHLAEVVEILAASGGRYLVVTPNLEEMLGSALDGASVFPRRLDKRSAAIFAAENASIDRLMSKNRKIGAFIEWLRCFTP